MDNSNDHTKGNCKDHAKDNDKDNSKDTAQHFFPKITCMGQSRLLYNGAPRLIHLSPVQTSSPATC